ncbi:MAG: response regulator transcription factor [Lachnospiraceae bacterium]|nr:response regulator transcription factor [Lachnospiraceae bacterium]
MKLLVIEDDKGLANGIAFSMERDGNEVFTAGTLKKGRELFEEKEPDAILLDLNLPDGDGIDFCRSIREISQVPVLMLTARDMETDEVQGLLSGADDYLTKPFSLAVLKARLDTVLRRSRMRTLENAGQAGSMAGMPGSGQAGSMTGMPGSGPHGPGACAEEMDTENALVSGDIRLVPGRMKVYCRGQEVECSATEYRLLYYLMENRGQVLLKEQILEHVWDSTGSYVDENTLQVTVRRLRRKLETNPSSPKYIRTVHGMGYIFAEGIGETR